MNKLKITMLILVTVAVVSCNQVERRGKAQFSCAATKDGVQVCAKQLNENEFLILDRSSMGTVSLFHNASYTDYDHSNYYCDKNDGEMPLYSLKIYKNTISSQGKVVDYELNSIECSTQTLKTKKLKIIVKAGTREDKVEVTLAKQPINNVQN